MNLAGHSMLGFWIDVKARAANLFCCQPENSIPMPAARAVTLSIPAVSESVDQQTTGGMTPPRTFLMLPVLVWGLGRS